MSFDVFGEPPDYNQTMACCVQCAWQGTYEEADYRKPSRDEQETFVCPTCGGAEVENLEYDEP